MSATCRCWVTLSFFIALLVACSSPEEKKQEFFQKGEQLYQQKEYINARLELKNAIQIDPDFAEAYRVLGMVELKSNNLQKAGGYFKKAVDLDPDNLKARFELGRLYLAARYKDKAKEIAASILKKSPDNLKGLFLHALVLYSEGENDKAQTILEGLPARGLQAPDLYLTLAAIAQLQKQSSKVKETLLKGIEVNPEYLPLRQVLVRYYLEEKQFGQAAATQKEIIRLDPENMEHPLNLAAIYWESGKKEQGREQIKAILAVDPPVEANFEKAFRFYAGRKQFKPAEDVLRQGMTKMPKNFQMNLLLSELFLNQNNTQGAIDTLEKGLTYEDDPAQPGIIQTKNALAKVYLMNRNIDQADRYASEVIKEKPNDITGRMIKGQIYLRRGNAENAVSVFRTIIDDKPEFVDGYLLLAEAHILNKENNLAIDTLQKALKIAPRSRKLLSAIVRFYTLSKDLLEAGKYMAKLHEYYPKDPKISAGLGDLLIASHKLDQAEDMYSGIQGSASARLMGKIKLARLYAFQKKWDEAIQELKRAVRENPKSPVAFSALIQMYMAAERPRQAIAICQDRIKQLPDDPGAYYILGKIHLSGKRYDPAATNLKKAIKLQPAWVKPYIELARSYAAANRAEDAIKTVKLGLEKSPGNPQAILMLGGLYERYRQYTEAIAIYQKAVDENPRFWIAMNNLAFLLCEHSAADKNLERAVQYAKAAIKLNPKEPMILDTLGWIYYKKGVLDQADHYVGRSLAAAPESTVLNYHMGMIQYKKGNHVEALRYLEKAVSGKKPYDGKKEAQRIYQKLRG